MKRSRQIIVLSALALLTACSYNHNDYSCFTDIDPVEGWDYARTLVYMPEPADSIAEGMLLFYVRHSNDYPYSNLWIEVESQQPLPDGHVAARLDTFCIELADIYGNWHGKGRGTSFQLTDTLATRMLLPAGAPLRLRHIMRPEHVRGIEKVGLIFKASQPDSRQ